MKRHPKEVTVKKAGGDLFADSMELKQISIQHFFYFRILIILIYYFSYYLILLVFLSHTQFFFVIGKFFGTL